MMAELLEGDGGLEGRFSSGAVFDVGRLHGGILAPGD